MRRFTNTYGWLLGLHFGLALSFSLTSAQGAASHRDTSADNELLLAGDDIITTATKTAQRLSDSPAAATVITDEEIARSGAVTVPELLRSVPGVDVMEPNKSQANVSIRGFNSVFANKVLVMVNGRAINQDIQGNIFWNTEPLLISRIKRIEIVRGPGSVLYGANAFGGVINIFLKSPAEMAEKKPGTFTGALGNHSSQFAEAVYSTGSPNGWAFTLGAGFHGTDGFGGRQDGQVHDRSRVPIFTADLQKPIGRGSLLLSLNNSDSQADLSSEEIFHDAKWHTSSVALSYDQDRGANPITARAYGSFIRDTAGSSNFMAADTYDLELQQERRISERHDLNYGGSYRGDRFISSITGPDRHSRHLAGLFFQDQYQIGAATSLFAGVRWDRHSVYGSQVSPRVSLVHHLDYSQTVRLSYGTAFRAPTLIENYLDFAIPIVSGLNLNIVGNANIKPEKVASLEAGYRRDLRNGYVGANLFYNQITDVIETASIQFAPSPPFPPGVPTKLQYQNLGTAHAAGLELEGGFTLPDDWHGRANYAYQDVQNQGGQPTDFSPKHKINLVLESDPARRWNAYAATHFVSASHYATAQIRAYTTVDARLGYRLGRSESSWTVSAAATNLLDDHHREYVDALSPLSNNVISESFGRTFWLTVAGKL